MTGIYFDDRFKLLLDKYSPAILRDLATALRQYGYTNISQIDFKIEIGRQDLVRFNVEAASLKDKITISFILPLYNRDMLNLIYQDALRTAPDLKSSGLSEKNVAFLFLLTIAYKKLTGLSSAINYIAHVKVSNGETSTVQDKMIISKYHQYSISPYTFAKTDIFTKAEL